MCEQCEQAAKAVSAAIDDFNTQQTAALRLIVNAVELAEIRAESNEPEKWPYVDVRPVVDKLTGKTVPGLCVFHPAEDEPDAMDVNLVAVVVAGDAEASDRYEPLAGTGLLLNEQEQEASGQ